MLDLKRSQRKRLIEDDNYLKENRDKMMKNVCSIVHKHIETAERVIKVPTEGALLFHDQNFVRGEWKIQTTSGYSSTMPLFIYVLHEIEY